MIEDGGGYIDLVNVTKGLWSQLKPGDAEKCACHFCVYEVSAGGAGGGSSQEEKEEEEEEEKEEEGSWRRRVSGSVCGNLANILANEICDGKREDLPND